MSSCLLLALAVFGIGMWAGRRPRSDAQQDQNNGTPVELEDPPWKQRFENPGAKPFGYNRGGFMCGRYRTRTERCDGKLPLI